MAKTLDGRLSAIERKINAPPGSRLCMSHAQFVQLVSLALQGVEESEAWKLVGPPSAVVPPGCPSHAELVLQAAAPPPAHPSPPERATDLPPDLVKAVDAIVSEAPVRRHLTEAEALEADGVHVPPKGITGEPRWRERLNGRG